MFHEISQILKLFLLHIYIIFIIYFYVFYCLFYLTDNLNKTLENAHAQFY